MVMVSYHGNGKDKINQPESVSSPIFEVEISEVVHNQYISSVEVAITFNSHVPNHLLL